MKISGLGSFFTMLYDDRMDIYRTHDSLNSDMTTDISYNQTPSYTDVPCRISFSSDDFAADAEVDRNPIKFNPKVFCQADVDIRAGDYVVVRRYTDPGQLAKTYKGFTAESSWYSTHQEVYVRVDEGA